MGASMKTRAPGMSSNAAAHKIRLLRGARAIGDYIGEPPRRVWYIFANKLAPIGREGKSLIADPRLLDEHYQKITQVEVRAETAPFSGLKPVQSTLPPVPFVKKRRLVRRLAARTTARQPLAAKPDGDDHG